MSENNINSSDYTINELVDISDLQKLILTFSNLTGLGTAVLDLNGKVLAASQWQEICLYFHRKNSQTALRCRESDTILAGKIEDGRKYNLYKCKNGLVDVSVPFYVGDLHLGNIFIGQFLLESPDISFFMEQAEEFGFDKDAYINALNKVPVVDEKTIENAITFITTLTSILGNTALNRKKLFELNRELEQRVQDRTSELSYTNERLRVLSEVSFEGILLSENGIIIEANDRAAEMFHFNNSFEMTGIKMVNFVAPEFRDEVSAKIMEGYEKPYETMAVRRDGTQIPVEINAKMFTYKNRKVRGTSIRDLSEKKSAENEIQTLRGILPICSFCKKIRDDKGYWEQVETYIEKHSDADFTHGICPECFKLHYPNEYKKIFGQDD